MRKNKILLLESHPKKGIILQLNINVYIDGETLLATNFEKLCEKIEKEEDAELVIIREKIKGKDVLKQLTTFLGRKKKKLPVIVLGDLAHPQDDVYFVEKEDEVRRVLQKTAQILGVTPEQMANIETDEYYAIPSSYFTFIVYFPCDVYANADNKSLLFTAGSAIDREKLRGLINQHDVFYVESHLRLKFVNSLTNQIMSLVKKLHSSSQTLDEKMDTLNKTVEYVADQFRHQEMDSEVIDLAKSSIESMCKVADEVEDIKRLMDKLLDRQYRYQYIHAQVLTFVCLHVIKVMDWWQDDMRQNLSFAAFFHDMTLFTDKEVKYTPDGRNENHLEEQKHLNEEEKDRIKHHALNASQLLKKIKGVTEEATQIVREHHGTVSGIGFKDEFPGLGILSKVFIVSEEWTHLSLRASKAKVKIDTHKEMQKLLEKYSDPECQEVIRTFGFLKSTQFGLAILELIDEEELRLTATQVDQYLDAAIHLEKMLRDDSPLNENHKMIARAIKEKFDEAQNDFNNNNKKSVEKITEVIILFGDFVTVIEEGLDKEDKGLLSKFVVMEKKRMTELMLAAEIGRIELVEYFSKFADNLEKRDSSGMSCLHYAVVGGSVETAKFFINRNLDLNAVDSGRRNALFFALQCERQEVFDYLIEHNMRINQQTIGGVTLPLLAAFKGNLGALKKLVNKDAPWQAKDYKNKNILDYAKEGKNQEVIHYVGELLAETKNNNKKIGIL